MGPPSPRRLADTTAAGWALRWFTPVLEDDLCGHATLATAHAIITCTGERGIIRLLTRSVSSPHGPVRTVRSRWTSPQPQ